MPKYFKHDAKYAQFYALVKSAFDFAITASFGNLCDVSRKSASRKIKQKSSGKRENKLTNKSLASHDYKTSLPTKIMLKLRFSEKFKLRILKNNLILLDVSMHVHSKITLCQVINMRVVRVHASW